MRILIGLAVASVVGVAGLLFVEESGRRIGESHVPPQPDREPAPEPDAPLAAPSSAEIPDFVASCIARGPRVVPELLALLASGEDRRLLPRWRFADGRVKGYPTLRSIYLDALASIPGPEATRALQAVLGKTEAVEESYQCALALHERDAAGWGAVAVEKADVATSPARLDIQRRLITLAAEQEPAAVAERIVARAPRNDDGRDPQVLAAGLAALPLASAQRAADRLFDDDVTRRAKSRFLDVLLSRPEPELYRHIGGLSGSWDNELRTIAAYAAARSRSFFSDAARNDAALANGDRKQANAIATRYHQRLTEVRALITTLLGSDVDTSNDPRAASLRRSLKRHQSRIK